MNDGCINQSQVDKFYHTFRTFHTKAYKHCVKRLHLNDVFIKHCVSIEFSKRSDIPFNYVERTLTYFPHIDRTMVTNLNILTLVQDEYIEYQSMIKDNFPPWSRKAKLNLCQISNRWNIKLNNENKNDISSVIPPYHECKPPDQLVKLRKSATM